MTCKPDRVGHMFTANDFFWITEKMLIKNPDKRVILVAFILAQTSCGSMTVIL